MAAVDIIDELFVVADPGKVRAHLGDAELWHSWFPDLCFTCYQDRGLKGVRWEVSGSLSGAAEVWIEPFGDGVIVHAYLRADPSKPPRSEHRFAVQTKKKYVWPLKQHLLDAKDELEGSRRLGEPRIPIAERVVSQPTQPAAGTDDEGAIADARPDDVEHPDLS